MPLIKEIRNRDTVLLVWSITEDEDELLARACLCEADLSCFGQLHTPGRRKEWLAVRVILNEGFPAENLRVVYTVSGAPALADDSRYISITHTRGYAAVLVAPVPCGVDMELADRDFRHASSRFLSGDESARFDENLYGLLWCAKEALYKAGNRRNIDWRRDIELLSIEASAMTAKYRGRIIRALTCYREDNFIMAVCYGF